MDARAPWEKEEKPKPSGRMAQRIEQKVKPPPYATSLDSPPAVVKAVPAKPGATCGVARSPGPVSTVAAKTSAPWDRDENRFRSRIGVVPGTWSNIAPYATDRSSRQSTTSPAKD
ncbi:hypothetical protein CBR_g21023 [Chara braunii]|uniref:Uncharacterized protein n=1 Tax=Chara braunii TaxID=69332 RepID=A0A388L0E3_CHABU|nr:hypothetical protein CBR_g21023 [Chara braunii]|eukprot:GBG75779.1 hypothetical protein CBR_g21023 [Chara braunii]